ncbi:hypothetical protein CYMTET_43808 [Cymbomonas tetramitiformis]|uniref:Uncharacterized protein n=1 Tax=Cymbomonas tetramitiformis TaxID=36881 RepID=A0AAE0C3D5_9CHLO|nr:hypothetical protein CYMTET_43808 [Cymbomonas tetramitiformis]
MDDLLECVLKIVLSDDFFSTTYAEFGVTVAAKQDVNLTRIFFSQVEYLRKVFCILHKFKVTQICRMDLGGIRNITWNGLLTWMFFVVFHVSRMHEGGGPGGRIFAEWLSHGAIDLVDAYTVRAVLAAQTENVTVVAGTAHVESVAQYLRTTVDR